MIKRQTSSNRTLRSLFVLALLGAGAVHAQDTPLSARAGLLSALIVHGLQFSDARNAVVLAGADLYSNTGWSIGAAAMAFRSIAGNQAGGWALRARRDWSLSENWTLAIGARHDGYVGDAFLQSWCSNEGIARSSACMTGL